MTTTRAPVRPASTDRGSTFAEHLAGARRPDGVALPPRRVVAAWADELLAILFPQLDGIRAADASAIGARLDAAGTDLRGILDGVVGSVRAADVATALSGALSELHARVVLDAEAIVAGDPAATGLDEVIVAYPGFLAIAFHRLAHELHRLGVPIVPRLLSEEAHSRTGIDIHPGATIGRSFCIDHGTGIVVGETAIIGDEVKLYQGVTLGALSVAKDAAGTKRHPTIEDRVVLYASATVLGGDTVVGHDSVIGGNVFLTHSVPHHSVVYHTSQVRVRSATDAFELLDYVI